MSILSLYFIVFVYTQFSAAWLTPIQQKQVRSILSNPTTPHLIKVKTQNIVYEHYVDWANGLAKNATWTVSPDLTQCVSLGLMKAIRKYNWSRNTHFTSYAKKYVLSEVYAYTTKSGQTRRDIQFVSPANQWIFDLCPRQNRESTKHDEIQKHDILCLLDPEERRLFEHVYGGAFTGEKGKSVRQICDLMAYGNEETYRIRKNRLAQKILKKGKL